MGINKRTKQSLVTKGEKIMKQVNELKKQDEETKNQEEAKEVIEKNDLQLTDKELDNVTGGYRGHCNNFK